MRNTLLFIISLSLLGGCSWFATPPSRVDNPIIEGVNYVGVTVTDLDKTAALYRGATEIQTVRDDRIENDPLMNELLGRADVKLTSRLMRGVNMQLLFMQFDNPSDLAKRSPFVDANGPGIAHLAFQVVDKTETYQKFLAGGGKVMGTREMQLNPKTHVSYSYSRDLDDIMVEIEHVDIEPLNLPKPPKNNRRIRHISLATTDMNRAIDFYSILLETSNPRRSGNWFHISNQGLDNLTGFTEAEMEMSWFQVRNLELEIIQYYNPETTALNNPRPIDATGFNMIVFDVRDMAATKEKLLEAGGTLVTESTTAQGDAILFGRDPDGNLLGFQKLDPSSPFSAKNFKNNGLE